MKRTWSTTFHDKSGDTILLATSNLWDNIQIVKTHIFKYNIPNSVSLVIRHLDIEILYLHFKYTFDNVIYYILNNIEDAKKIYFPI